MSFFQRVLSYVANELVVNRLANRCGAGRLLARAGALLAGAEPPLARTRSTTFQRFAIKTDAAMRELQQKGTQQKGELLKKGAEHTDGMLKKSSEFARAFAQELTKGLRSAR